MKSGDMLIRDDRDGRIIAPIILNDDGTVTFKHEKDARDAEKEGFVKLVDGRTASPLPHSFRWISWD